MSVQDLIYQQHSENVPTDLLEEYNSCLGTTFRHGHARDCIKNRVDLQEYDDDWVFGDDTVFEMKNGLDVNVYSIIYFVAAALFVVSGVLDMFHPEAMNGVSFIVWPIL